jgi:hypothetical protein
MLSQMSDSMLIRTTARRERKRQSRGAVAHGIRLALTFLVIEISLVLRALGGAFYAVDFSSQANWTWSGVDHLPLTTLTGVFLPGAPTGVTTLGGIPFNITSNAAGKQAWGAATAAGGGPNVVSITIDVNVYGVTDVYTLINTFCGQPGPNSYASLTFTGSGGASYTKALIGNVDIRDFNEDGFTNSINGSTTTNVLNVAIDIQNTPGRLDMQDIALPSAFATQALTTIQLVDTGHRGFQRVALDGVTVASSAPEPSTLALLGVGAVSLLCFRCWRRRQAT